MQPIFVSSPPTKSLDYTTLVGVQPLPLESLGYTTFMSAPPKEEPM